jgi:hypothetical protein
MTEDQKAELARLKARVTETENQMRQAHFALVEFVERFRYTPCLKCGRRVPSPCNTAEDYYEGGPWDFSCEAIWKGEP